MMRYQHCIFDLYGTLVDIRTDEASPDLWEAMAGWYTRHGAPWRPQALHAAFLDAVQSLEAGAAALCAGLPEAYPEIGIEQAFLQMFCQKGLKADVSLAIQTGQYFRRCSTKYIRLYPGAAALLRALRANGKKVWLLSNAQRIFTMPELESLGIREMFDGIYLSSDYGCKKPDTRFFERLLQEQNIPQEAAVMVGNDGACDIAGAAAVGLATVYICSNLSPAEPPPAADHVLEEMDLFYVRDILLS